MNAVVSSGSALITGALDLVLGNYGVKVGIFPELLRQSNRLSINVPDDLKTLVGELRATRLFIIIPHTGSFSFTVELEDMSAELFIREWIQEHNLSRLPDPPSKGDWYLL